MIFITLRAVHINGTDWYDYCDGLPASSTLEEIVSHVRNKVDAGYKLTEFAVKYPPLDTNPGE